MPLKEVTAGADRVQAHAGAGLLEQDPAGAAALNQGGMRKLANVVNAHAESLGVEGEGALPRRAGETALVVRLEPWEGIHQVGLADTAQNAGHHDVRHREIGAGDPLAVFETPLDILEPTAGKLIPGDVQGRTRVVQWCFAAVSTVEPTLVCLDLIEIFDRGNATHKVKTEVRKIAGRWLGDVERRLEGREWIACADFTVADIMMACVLRGIRKTDLMDPFPRVKAYYERCMARPAWQRTLALYAARIGVSVDDIR